jgi:coenzyme PQQ synthesis protein D (PqqD)
MPDILMSVEYRRGENYVYRFTVGEHLLVALHARRDDPLYALTPTGALLWERLTEWRSTDELAGDLLEEYDISREQALTDVQEFIEQLKLIEAVEIRAGPE